MKTIITFVVLFIAFTNQVFSSNYEEVMSNNITKIYQSKTSAELLELANQFERIANVEKEEWLPAYYASYCFVRSTLVEKTEKETAQQNLDKAQEILDKLQKQFNNESEIFALQAFIYQLRITDMSKGYKYSKLAGESIAKAEKLNPENPRVYYLRGSNTFHTPKFFGGGAENAKPDLEKAAHIFSSQKPANKLAPGWGEYHNQQLLNKCN